MALQVAGREAWRSPYASSNSSTGDQALGEQWVDIFDDLWISMVTSEKHDEIAENIFDSHDPDLDSPPWVGSDLDARSNDPREVA